MEVSWNGFVYGLLNTITRGRWSEALVSSYLKRFGGSGLKRSVRNTWLVRMFANSRSFGNIKWFPAVFGGIGDGDG